MAAVCFPHDPASIAVCTTPLAAPLSGKGGWWASSAQTCRFHGLRISGFEFEFFKNESNNRAASAAALRVPVTSRSLRGVRLVALEGRRGFQRLSQQPYPCLNVEVGQAPKHQNNTQSRSISQTFMVFGLIFPPPNI